MTNYELKAKIESNVAELEDRIANYLALAGIKLHVTVQGEYLNISSDDMVDTLSGVGAAVFSEIHVSMLGVIKDGYVWFAPKLSYVHPSGGSNGVNFMCHKIAFHHGDNRWEYGREIG